MIKPASIAGHPIHPMLIAFPIGLWVWSFIALIVFLSNGSESWKAVSLYTLAAGDIGALAAAVPGFIDYLYIKTPDARRIATWHLVLNLTIVTLLIIAFFLFLSGKNTTTLVLFIISVAMLLVSGWLGGSLVYIHRVAVYEPGKEPYPGEAMGGAGTAHPAPG